MESVMLGEQEAIISMVETKISPVYNLKTKYMKTVFEAQYRHAPECCELPNGISQDDLHHASELGVEPCNWQTFCVQSPTRCDEYHISAWMPKIEFDMMRSKPAACEEFLARWITRMMESAHMAV